MLGVVMCGSLSSRDKNKAGLAATGDHHWATLAAQKLLNSCPRVVYSVKESQLDPYGHLVNKKLLIADDDSIDTGSPLTGVLSVHMNFPNEDLLILTCDLPDIDDIIIHTLIEEKNSKPGYEVYCFSQPDGEPEPLCSIYSS